MRMNDYVGLGWQRKGQETQIPRIAVINSAACIRCGRCSQVCAFVGSEHDRDCYGCSLCVHACPEGAIVILPRSVYDVLHADRSVDVSQLIGIIKHWVGATSCTPDDLASMIRTLRSNWGLDSQMLEPELVRQGLLEFLPSSWRQAREQAAGSPMEQANRTITPKVALRTREIPILGVIPAGSPIMVFNDCDCSQTADTLLVDEALLPKGGDIFGLRVDGYSMVDAMIADGDIVVVRKQALAQSGDLVVAWLAMEGETTLKRFRRDGNTIFLEPANPSFAAITASAQNVVIQGRVVAVLSPR